MEKPVTATFEDITEFVREADGQQVIDVTLFLTKFNATMTEISPAMWFTRPVRVMQDAARTAKDWSNRARLIKRMAQASKIEDMANLMLSAQCFAESFASQCAMWLQLKAGDPTRAWDALIDAQDYLEIANRAHEERDYIFHRQRLDMAERLLFPRPVFQSCGFVYRAGQCTICNERFDRCDHQEGEIYCGRLCRELNRRNLQLDHIAIVPEPRDKRCRVYEFEDDDGNMRDYFTGEVVPDKPSESNSQMRTEEVSGRHIRGFAYVLETLEDV